MSAWLVLVVAVATCVLLVAAWTGFVSWWWAAAPVISVWTWRSGRALWRWRKQRAAGDWGRDEAMAEVDAWRAVLTAQFERAARALRRRRGFTRATPPLPVYMVLGPADAGKSTAIRDGAGAMRLLGSQREVIREAERCGCDWWLTGDAVLLDVAGRNLTEPTYEDAWPILITQLRRVRSPCCLNGIVIALSVRDLLQDEEARDLLAEDLRQRLATLMAMLELRVPVYLMVTKSDLLGGFVESFEALDESERGQIFGFALPVAAERADVEQLDASFVRLMQVVARHNLARLGALRDREARHAAFAFAQQLEDIAEAATRLLGRTLACVGAEPQLRGVYFTSAVQEGEPIDRHLVHASEALGLSVPPAVCRAPARRKAYFLADLFRSVLRVEQTLSALSEGAQLRRRALGRALAALVVVAVAIMGLSTVYAYASNRTLLQGTRDDLRRLARLSSDAARHETLQALGPVRARYDTLLGWSDRRAPWSLRLGLYQGDAALPPVRAAYAHALRRRLLEPAQRALEEGLLTQLRGSLAGAHGDVDGALYERLRAYALLTFPKEPGEPGATAAAGGAIVDSLIAGPLAAAWSTTERAALGVHLARYFALQGRDSAVGLTRTTSLFEEARGLLRRGSAVGLAIDRLVAHPSLRSTGHTLASLVGWGGLPLRASVQVPGAFTRRAWEAQVRPLLDGAAFGAFEPWVMGADAVAATERCALRSEYFTRYIEAWKAFVGSLRIEAPRDHMRALVLLQDLTRGQPALLERLTRNVAAELDLRPAAPAEVPAQATAQEGVLAQLRARFGGVSPAPTQGTPPCDETRFVTEAQVRRALAGFVAFGVGEDAPTGGAAAPLTALQIYQEQLVYVRDALQAYIDDPATAESLTARLGTARARVRSLIETQEVGWRPRFDALLWPPVEGAAARSMAALRGAQGAAFCTAVTAPFDRRLRNRYPFSKLGQDAALADVADFYRPEHGVLWSYYEGALKRDVPAIGGRFDVRTDDAARYTPELSRFLERSARVSSVLFAPSASEPQAAFEVRVRPAPGVAQIVFVVDGQTVDFHNGPERWHHLVWPGEARRRGASLRVVGQGVDETIVQDGEWGLFRLLERGSVSFDQGARFFSVRFRLRTQHDVVIDVRPARVDNPFVGEGGFLEAFRGDGIAPPRAIAKGARRCAEPSSEGRGGRS